MNLKAMYKAVPIMFALCISAFSFAEPVWIDVRSALEHKLDSIEGDTRISHSEIVSKVNELYPDRSTEIRLYCRSGNRSGKATAALREAGYTDVSNAGSIDDARQLRGIKD